MANALIDSVQISVKDVVAQDLLWAYAQRRRVIDAAYADGLEGGLIGAGYKPGPCVAGVVVVELQHEVHVIPRTEVRHVHVHHEDTSDDAWVLTYTLGNSTPRDIRFSDESPDAMKGSIGSGDYNGVAAGTMMGFLTRGAHDLRIAKLHSGGWTVKSVDGRW